MERQEIIAPREYRNSAIILGTDSAIMVNGDVYGINFNDEIEGVKAICPDMKDCIVYAPTRHQAIEELRKKIPTCERLKVYEVKEAFAVAHKKQIEEQGEPRPVIPKPLPVKKETQPIQAATPVATTKATGQAYSISLNEAQRNELLNHLRSKQVALQIEIETINSLIAQITT